MRKIKFYVLFLLLFISNLTVSNCYAIETKPEKSLEEQISLLYAQLPPLQQQLCTFSSKEVFEQISQITSLLNQIIETAEAKIPLQQLREMILTKLGLSTEEMSLQLEELAKEIKTMKAIDIRAESTLREASRLLELSMEQDIIVFMLEKNMKVEPEISKATRLVANLAQDRLKTLISLKQMMQFVDLVNDEKTAYTGKQQIEILSDLIAITMPLVKKTKIQSIQSIEKALNLVIEARENRRCEKLAKFEPRSASELNKMINSEKQIVNAAEDLFKSAMQEAIQLVELTTKQETLLGIMRTKELIPEDTIIKAKQETEQAIKLMLDLAIDMGEQRAVLFIFGDAEQYQEQILKMAVNK